MLLLATTAMGLGGCDNPPPRQPKALPLPKGESTLDDLIRKSEQKPAAPAVAGPLEGRPARLDFPSVRVGEGFTRQVEIANLGELPVHLRQIHVAGGGLAFRSAGDCAAGEVIAAHGSCVVAVSYRPSDEGSHLAELVIDHDGAGGAIFLPLQGAAKAARPTAPVVANPPPAPLAQAALGFLRTRQEGAIAVETDAAPSSAAMPPVDADYTAAGLPGIVSTLPVDRHRVVTADRYIPAVLENTINSQLPGRAIAVVERNVYGEQGGDVLIPAGSRVIGQYQSLARMGEARLDIDWNRIIRPDGVSINIDDRAADVMGRTGLPGELDTRFFEKYGSSLLTSVIAAAGDWAFDGNSTAVAGPLGGVTESMSGKARAGRRLGNDLDQLGQRMVQENVDIRPVLTVPQGTRLVIVPAEDIWLQDPRHLRAATPPKGQGVRKALAAADDPARLLPGIVDMLAENPAVQKIAPEAAQQIMQATVLQQLRNNGFAVPPASADRAQPTAAPERTR